MRYFKFVITFFILSYQSFSQLELHKTYGFNVGVIAALGTHQQRFGVVVQGYYVYNFAQINASVRLYDNFKDLGPKGEHAELNTALGLCLGYGSKSSERNLFLSSISNQTGYKNSVAYSYNFWWNKIKTSQVTGILALQFNHFSFITENDLLAKPALDRFRTGAFLIQYQTKHFQYAVNCTMWTGRMGEIVKDEHSFFYKGYSGLNGSVYGNLSHGLLSAQVKYASQYGQYIQANVGADAEGVRNVVQNKIIHDMPFIPEKWNKAQNVHIPMIDSEGNQFLYLKTQKVRKPRAYINMYLCPNIFY